MKLKRYDYLIAYNFSQQGYPNTGTIQISRDKKITTFEDINELNKTITELIEGASNVSIYNFILLGRNRH